MIKYYKLFDMLNRRGMRKTDLLKVISSPTLAKLSKGESITTEMIDKICAFLHCQPGDIMEHITSENDINTITENGKTLKGKYRVINKPILEDNEPTEETILAELNNDNTIKEIKN